MKYSQLISFNPIEDVIQLVTAGNKDKAREYVKTYVMSDSMADALQAPMIDQLQMDEVVDNKGVLVWLSFRYPLACGSRFPKYSSSKKFLMPSHLPVTVSDFSKTESVSAS